MAWIEVHQSLPTHRKVSKLRRALGGKDSRAQVVGSLVMLWLWAIDNAIDGDLSGLDAEDIAEAAGYTGKADRFLQGLVEAGFVDGDLRLHDWADYIGKLATQQEARKTGNRERQQRYRDRKKATDDNGEDGVTDNADGSVTDNARNALRNGGVTRYGNAEDGVTDNARNGATLPYLTVPNLTLPYQGDPYGSPPRAGAGEETGNEREIPTIAQVETYAQEMGITVDARRFVAVNSANGWRDGAGQPIRSWRVWLEGYARRSPPPEAGSDPRLAELEKLKRMYQSEEAQAGD